MLKSKFFKNNSVFMAGTLAGGLLGYAFHFVVSRQISIAQYGELQSLLSVFVIFGVFGSALSFFTVKHTSVFAAHNDFEAGREFAHFTTSRVFKILLAILLIMLLTSPLLAELLHFSSYFGFAVVSLATFFSTMAIIYMEILRGWQKFFLLSLAGAATALVKFISGAILANFFHTAAIVSLSLLFAAFVGWYFAKRWSRKTIGGTEIEPAKSNWRDKYFSETNVRQSARNIFIFSLTLILVSNLDIPLVKYFTSPETAGHYGAFALLGKIALWLNLSVVGVMLPEACAEGYSGKRPEKEGLLKSYGLVTAIGLGFALLYLVSPNFIVNIFFGERYILNTQILWLFALMSYLLSLLTLEANLSFAKHDFRVVYFLVATLVLMIAGAAKYHANLEQIVLAFATSFLAGYAAILFLNLSSPVIASVAKQSRKI